MKARTLKISKKLKKTNLRFSVFAPSLLIAGDWLEKAGFNIADFVKIEVAENQLIITKI